MLVDFDTPVKGLRAYKIFVFLAVIVSKDRNIVKIILYVKISIVMCIKCDYSLYNTHTIA